MVELSESDSSTRWLDVDLAQLASARDFVAQAIERFGLVPADAVAVMTSEVVSNAMSHAITDQVALRVSHVGRRARVEVHDDDSTVPVVRPFDPRRVGGVGMQLVSALADERGVEQIVDDGKVVWFEVSLDAMPG